MKRRNFLQMSGILLAGATVPFESVAKLLPKFKPEWESVGSVLKVNNQLTYGSIIHQYNMKVKDIYPASQYTRRISRLMSAKNVSKQDVRSEISSKWYDHSAIIKSLGFIEVSEVNNPSSVKLFHPTIAHIKTVIANVLKSQSDEIGTQINSYNMNGKTVEYEVTKQIKNGYLVTNLRGIKNCKHITTREHSTKIYDLDDFIEEMIDNRKRYNRVGGLAKELANDIDWTAV